MNQTPIAVKAGVVAGAVLLGSGFVYVRAGGRLPGFSEAPSTPAVKTDSTRTILPGSKSAAVVLPSDNPSNAPIEPNRRGPPANSNADSAANPTATPVLDSSARHVIMSSSKSIILSEPSDSPLARAKPVPKQPSPLEAAPRVPPPPPSPLEALRKPAQRPSATTNKPIAPAQQNVAPR